jgi:hypothetical protein
MKQNKTITILAAVILAIMIMPFASASLVLDNIQFDPAIVAAGDEVDIIIEFHDDSGPASNQKTGNSDYSFQVELQPDDSISEEYILIQDAYGDDLKGTVLSGEKYIKKFRVKVSPSAPSSNYELKLTGTWHYKGKAEGSEQYLRFFLPVKKEGIVLNIANIETLPAEVRPGDDYVQINARIENTGEKDAKEVEITLDLPKELESSYSNNNRVWVGLVEKKTSKEVSFFVDVDEDAKNNVYDINYQIDYADVDNNNYQKQESLPFLVKSRAYLEVVNNTGEGLAGETSKLYVTIKNTGEETAEAVDARIIKQNSQPFILDVRSDYIGELQPGEEATAIFDIKTTSDATIKEHDLKLVIRSKGDGDEGDDNIYTYNRRAKFTVTGKASNNLLWIGLGLAAVVVGIIVFNSLKRKKVKKK